MEAIPNGVFACTDTSMPASPACSPDASIRGRSKNRPRRTTCCPPRGSRARVARSRASSNGTPQPSYNAVIAHPLEASSIWSDRPIDAGVGSADTETRWATKFPSGAAAAFCSASGHDNPPEGTAGNDAVSPFPPSSVASDRRNGMLTTDIHLPSFVSPPPHPQTHGSSLATLGVQLEALVASIPAANACRPRITGFR